VERNRIAGQNPSRVVAPIEEEEEEEEEGIVTIRLRKYLEAVPGKYSVGSLQKTAILGT
jgi:hypothetical protein